MSPFLIAKLAAQSVAGLGVSKILFSVVKNNTVIQTATDKVLIKTGSLVLASMFVEKASNHVGDQFDSAKAWFEERKAEIESEESK